MEWEKFSKAKKPSPNELARSHAHLACGDTEGYIANSMAGRAKSLKLKILERLCQGFRKRASQ